MGTIVIENCDVIDGMGTPPTRHGRRHRAESNRQDLSRQRSRCEGYIGRKAAASMAQERR